MMSSAVFVGSMGGRLSGMEFLWLGVAAVAVLVGDLSRRSSKVMSSTMTLIEMRMTAIVCRPLSSTEVRKTPPMIADEAMDPM
jgi:hypothetical protein